MAPAIVAAQDLWRNSPMPSAFRRPVTFLLAGALVALSGCGSSTPAPEPVRLSQFHKGADRFSVITAVGKPDGTVQREGRDCDIYRLYTTGLSAAGRAGMTAGEVVTGIATLGLSEAVWAPVKAGTRPQQHTVLFCFRDDRLVDLYDKDPTTSRAADHMILDRDAYSRPVVAKVLPPEPVPAAGTVTLPQITHATVVPPAPVSADASPVAVEGEDPSTDALNGVSATQATQRNAPVWAYAAAHGNQTGKAIAPEQPSASSHSVDQ